MDTLGNETTPRCNETTCQLCGARLELKPTGRPPRFCSTAHRVRFHRLRARSNKAAVPDTPTAQGRHDALYELATVLEDLNPSLGVAGLRGLADRADELVFVFDAIAELAWVLDDHDEIACALDNLQHHRSTLERLCELDDLADDVAELTANLRAVRRYQEELEWAATESEEP